MMRYLTVLVIFAASVSASAQAIPDYDTDFIGTPLSDPVMQHNKETYVLYGCAYCHGVNLKPVGEATDLRTSAIVGTDVNANLIGAILRVGIPQTPKSSPMPQFSDLSEQEIRAIASYIHHTRARENLKVLTNERTANGTLARGKAYFEKNCSSCHSAKDMAAIGSKYSSAELREQVLDPKRFRSPGSFSLDNINDSGMNAGRVRHQQLLENYKKEDVANVVAYLRTLR